MTFHLTLWGVMSGHSLIHTIHSFELSNDERGNTAVLQWKQRREHGNTVLNDEVHSAGSHDTAAHVSALFHE